MGDLLMSGPAIRILKSIFDTRITILTSSMAAGIARMMPEIDEVFVCDLPWVKTAAGNTEIEKLIISLRERNFDAAVIFTVFSQSPFPAAMLAYQTGIPKVLAYCRENPYGLLTDWVADEEPYTSIRHQVQRDIDLVASVGAQNQQDCRLQVNVPVYLWTAIQTKLIRLGWNPNLPWLVLHPGVSEVKRQYPVECWVETGKMLVQNGFQIIVTGTNSEHELATEICQGISVDTFDATGIFELGEFVCLIKHSLLLLSVNTGPVHIAAAVDTPVVVLYAQTNPQHTPWMVPNRVLQFPVPAGLQSKNEVLKYLQQTIYRLPAAMPQANDIMEAVMELLKC
jgi:ADP-heptose:LPS heptosyltransferase